MTGTSDEGVQDPRIAGRFISIGLELVPAYQSTARVYSNDFVN
jgi:hypothetical protein